MATVSCTALSLAAHEVGFHARLPMFLFEAAYHWRLVYGSEAADFSHWMVSEWIDEARDHVLGAGVATWSRRRPAANSPWHLFLRREA